jgi:hypothetical protein
MSCEAIAKVLLLDDDTIRTWHRLYEEDGIEAPTNFGYAWGQVPDMIGYTSVGVGSSVVSVRINCLPEITLHHLRCA